MKMADFPEIEARVGKLLKDFSEALVADGAKEGVSYRKDLSGDYEMWRLARFIFSDILLIKVMDQPIEKINWVIPFGYKNKYRCTISHEKFGFYIYVNNGKTEDESKSIAEEIEAILLKVLLLIVPLVEGYAKEALRKGEVIVENSYSDLFRPYDYFRRMAVIKKKAALKVKPIRIISGEPQKRKRMVRWRAYSSVRYYERATYFSFFSLLEHICLLFLAFRNIPERNDVAKFSHMNWSDKFKTVFDIKDLEFEKFYNSFFGLAKYRRNPAAHGYARTAFSFYLEGARHKISCTLSDKEVALKWGKQEENFTVMEDFLKLLSKHPTTRNIFMYLNAGLNVPFSKDGLLENDRVTKLSNVEMNEYLMVMMRRYDDAANMDW